MSNNLETNSNIHNKDLQTKESKTEGEQKDNFHTCFSLNKIMGKL